MNKEQVLQQTAKTVEQGAAATGASLGMYQIIVEHKDLILTLCTIGSFVIAILGWLTSMAINWHFKRKHYKLAVMAAVNGSLTPEPKE